MKRYLCMVLVLLMLSGGFHGAQALVETPAVCALLIGEAGESMKGQAYYGVYQSGNFYLAKEELCRLLDGNTENTPAYSPAGQDFFLNGSGRTFELYSRYGAVKLLERCAVATLRNDGTLTTGVPCIAHEGRYYISLLHFLEYIGVGYYMDGTAMTPQLVLLPAYTVYDAQRDFYSTGFAAPFDWNALSIDDRKLENAQIAAFFGAVLAKHPLEAMLPGDREVELYVKETLIEILQMRGESDAALYSDWKEMAIYAGETANLSCSVLGQTVELCDVLGIGLNLSLKCIEGFEKLMAYSEIGQAEKTLLEDTLLSLYSDYSSTLAQKDVIRRVAQELQDNLSSQASFTGAVFSEVAMPILIDGVVSAYVRGKDILEVVKLMQETGSFVSDTLKIADQMFSAHEHLTIASIANEIACAARDIRLTAENVQSDPAFVRANDEKRRETMEILKAAIILQCKAEMVTYAHLVSAQVLTEDEKAFYEQKKQAVCTMMNKAAMAQLVYPHVAEDQPLSMQWIEDYLDWLQGDWQLDAASYEQLGGKNVCYTVEEMQITCIVEDEVVGTENFVLCGPSLMIGGEEIMWMEFESGEKSCLQGQFGNQTLTWEKKEQMEEADAGLSWFPFYIEAFYEHLDRKGRNWDDIVNTYETCPVTVQNGVMVSFDRAAAYLDNGISPDRLGELVIESMPDRLKTAFHTISSDAFDGYTIRYQILTLCMGIEVIESGAFTGHQMQVVGIGTGLKRLGEGAFTDCRCLWAIELPGTITTLTPRSIVRCEALRYIIIPPMATQIADDFIANESLQQVTVFGYPDSEAERYARRNGLGFVDMTAPGAFDQIIGP